MTSSISEPITNEFGNLCLHRQSRRGFIQDYIVTFDKEESAIENVLGKSYDLFENLMKHFKDVWVKVRLIDQVIYVRMNDQHEVIGQEGYHFASYQAEVYNPKDFYERHMSKIISRMDSFQRNDSRLMINTIKYIHIALTVT